MRKIVKTNTQEEKEKYRKTNRQEEKEMNLKHSFKGRYKETQTGEKYRRHKDTDKGEIKGHKDRERQIKTDKRRNKGTEGQIEKFLDVDQCVAKDLSDFS